jgi:hypothetical protein
VPAGAGHGGPIPVGHGWGAGRLCCRLSSVAAAAVSACPCRGRGYPPCRGVADARCPAGRDGVRASGQPLSAGCVDLAHLTSADEQAQRARAAMAPEQRLRGPPPSCRSRPRSRPPRPVSGWLRHRTPCCPLLLPEPRSVSGRLVSGRGRCLDGWCPPRTLPQPVGVRRYRKRTPARRLLEACSHCR